LLPGWRRQREWCRGAGRAGALLLEAATTEAHADVRRQRRPPWTGQWTGLSGRGPSGIEGQYVADPEPRARRIRRRGPGEDALAEQHRNVVGAERDRGRQGGRRDERVALPDRSVAAGGALLRCRHLSVRRPDR